jgi:hypothetical protein
MSITASVSLISKDLLVKQLFRNSNFLQEVFLDQSPRLFPG